MERLIGAVQGFSQWVTQSDGETAAAQAVGPLAELRALSVGRVVDTATIECRPVMALGRLGRLQSVRVLCCTGIGSETTGVSATLRELGPGRLAELYIRELGEAVHGSDMRASAVVVEAAAAAPSSWDRDAVLAASFAHAETGAPVLARARAEGLVALVDGLLAHGVEPEQIVALGLDQPRMTWETVTALARRGIRLGFTRIGDPGGLDDEAQAALLSYGIRRFGVGRVVLGLGQPMATLAPAALQSSEASARAAAGPGACPATADFRAPLPAQPGTVLSALRKRLVAGGVTDAELTELFSRAGSELFQ